MLRAIPPQLFSAVRLDGSNTVGSGISAASEDERLHNYQQLKEDANKKIANKQCKEAIDLYIQALEIEGLTPEQKAVVYSNLSYALTEVSPKDKEKIHEALQYAKTACLLLPEWWRGFQRKGRAYFLLNKYKKAVIGKYLLGGFIIKYKLKTADTISISI